MPGKIPLWDIQNIFYLYTNTVIYMKKTNATLFLLFFSHFLFAQQDNSFQVLEPSPAVSELGKFGLASVNLSDGAFKASIPVYEYKTKNLSVPLALVYSTNGFSVNKVPGRVGMDWLLLAGGSIGRTIIGDQNEYGNWVTYPPDWPYTNGEDLYYFIGGMVPRTKKTVPDIFTYNFNGVTGRFIRGSGKSPGDNDIIKLEQTNLAITAFDNSLNYGFSIVDASGTEYLFLDVEESLSSNNCIHDPNRPFVKNAWLLSKMIHPQGDTIYFQYETSNYSYAAGERQTLTSKLSDKTEPCSPCSNISTLPVSRTCAITIQNHSLRLSKIYSNQRGVVTFNYAARLDMPGDYVVTKISVYDATADPAGNITYLDPDPLHAAYFDYDYVKAYDNSNDDHSRLFLKSFSADAQTYSFNYYDLDGLPSRFSKSQDHFGFFNGKSNSSLVPPPPVEADRLYLQNYVAFANRNPDWTYSKKGCLSSITYPTKGIDSVIYEAHTVYRPDSYDCDDLNFTNTVSAQGTSACKKYNIFYSQPFQVNCLRTASLTLENNLSGSGSCLYNNYYTRAKVISADDYPLPVDYPLSNFPYAVQKGETGSFNVGLSPGMYVLCVAVGGDGLGTGSLSYQDNNNNEDNKEAGGLRVKKILSYAAPADPPVVKRVHYNLYNHPNSSGVTFDQPAYGKQLFIGETCPPVRYTECVYNQYFSTLLNTPSYSGNNIYYPYITEIYGENAEGGYIEHEFNVSADARGAALAGPNLDEMPLSNYGIYNGQEKEIRYYLNNMGNFRLSKQVKKHFRDDARLSDNYTFYSFQIDNPTQYNYFFNQTSSYDISDLRGISISRFDLLGRWIYPDSVTTVEYNAAGQSIREHTISIYDDTAHKLPTQVFTEKSSEKVNKALYKYPHDFAAQQPYTAMVGRHIWQPVVEQLHYTGPQPSTATTFVQSSKTEYGFWNGTSWTGSVTSQVLPQRTEEKVQGNNVEPRVYINRYDSRNNLAELQKANDAKEVYLWGYEARYPVAKIVGSDYTAVIGIVTQAQIDAATATADNDAGVRSLLHALRAAFASDPKVRVSTYTYAPLVGMTSETDPAGRTTYYEYDSFGRLSLAKDDQGNVVKKYCYNYAGQPINCNP